MLDMRTNGTYRGNACHRSWNTYCLNGCGLDEFGSSLKTSRYVMSARAAKKDGTLKKYFSDRLHKALHGDTSSQKWLADRDCYLLVG